MDGPKRRFVLLSVFSLFAGTRSTQSLSRSDKRNAMAHLTSQSDNLPERRSSFSPMTWLIGGTLLAALSEWLMLELLRTPYRPPSNMLTLLGIEKYGLVTIMIGLAAIWLIFFVVFLTRNRFTIKNYLAFTAVIAAILTFIGYIISYPLRDVTPWNLLWS